MKLSGYENASVSSALGLMGVLLLGGMIEVISLPAQQPTVSSSREPHDASDRVAGHPYSAERRFSSVKTLADGTTEQARSGGSEARDSQGRTYSAGERHWTYQDHGKPVLKSEMLYRIYDPIANTETHWDSTSREAKVIHFPHGPRNGIEQSVLDAFGAIPGNMEKLGPMTIDGITAEGTRNTYTVPADESHNGPAFKVTHERWYCPELRIVVLETNDDPRSGAWRNELVTIVRGEPNITKYRPPAGYTIRHVEVPSQ